MEKHRSKGAATEVEGSVKEAIAKVTGDCRTESDGRADQVAGKTQRVVGDIKDAVR